MRKINFMGIIILSAFLILLSGCGILSLFEENDSFSTTIDTAGGSPDNPVPLGEYAYVKNTEDCIAQIKITEIIRGEEANNLVDSSFSKKPNSNQEYMIIKFNINVSKLSNGTYRPYGFGFNILRDNGTLSEDYYQSDISESLGLKNFSEIEFAAAGSVDTFVEFLIDKEETRCLFHRGSKTYFSLT
jgi:hypothetical protein